MSRAGLARRALEAYAVPIARVVPLKHVYNMTFRVVGETSEWYVLRISHPRRARADVVRSELLWLAALSHEDGLRVPDPLRNKEGEYVTVLSDAASPQPVLCALFRWIPGRFASRSLCPAHLRRVGAFTAHLHDHAASWERPAGFVRPRVEALDPLHQEREEGFDAAAAARVVRAIARVGTPEDGAVVAAVIQRVWALLQELGDRPADFGLIHADLHQWNYLFRRGEIGVIDFDDCGFGHWLYDLAVTLYCLEDRPDYTALEEAFLAGYRERRSLSSPQEAHLQTFIALRRLQDLLWVIGERDHPAFRDRWQSVMRSALESLRAFLNQRVKGSDAVLNVKPPWCSDLDRIRRNCRWHGK